jgi:tRNA threonylcarbamoyladenosine biosynthesis protein TsaB
MILLIDTSQHEFTLVALIRSDGCLIRKKILKQEFQQSERLLPMIDDVLRKAKTRLTSLTGVAVVSGPGGFTSLRVGISTANALAFGLGIPVVGLSAKGLSNSESFAILALKSLNKGKRGKWVVPQYGREPNITYSKKISHL